MFAAPVMHVLNEMFNEKNMMLATLRTWVQFQKKAKLQDADHLKHSVLPPSGDVRNLTILM